MNIQDDERFKVFCEQASKEQDSKTLLQHVDEINTILAAERKRQGKKQTE